MSRRKSDATDGDAVTPDPGEAAAGSTPALPEEETPREPEPAADAPAEPLAAAAPAEPGPGVHDEPEYPEEHPEEHHDDGGPTFAARALTWLLILIAGVALGIWGAPRLAPMLPSGLAPVAAWLTPGQQVAEARVAELGTRLESEIGALRTSIDQAQSRLAEIPTADPAAGAVSELDSRLTAEIADLRDTLAQLDGAEASQRLARAESAIEGQAAELAAIKEQISGGAAAAGALSQETSAAIDLYRAEVEGLRAEMGDLSDKVASLETRIDEVAADAGRQVESARAQAAEAEAQAQTVASSAQVEADLAQVRAALAAGLPYADAAGRLAEHPAVAMPEPLLAAAETGVPSMAALRDSFPDAAHDAIRASIMASAGDGVLARSRAFVEAQVASRSLTPQEGSAPDAVLSRMEDRLRHDDLQGTIEEAAQLPSEAAAAMAGWLDSARRRLEAEAALGTLESGTAATN